MLLQRLKDYADRQMSLPPPLYSETPVRYIIDLEQQHDSLTATVTDTADPSAARTKRGQRRLMPQVSRSVAIVPLLFADKADYTLGIGGEQAKPERVANCHAAYIELVRRCAEATNDPHVQAVLAFLDHDPLAQLALPSDFDPGGLMTFRVDGVFPSDLPAVQAFWVAEHDPSAHGAKTMQCIVCGQERPVMDRLQGKIKGVPGGQPSGTAIISANASAFESYGLEASLVAPTCANCGERFTKALNELLSSQDHRIVMAGMAFVAWTRDDVGFSFSSYLTQAEPAQVRELVKSVKTGKPVPGVDETAFYATVLSGSGGRTVVRDWVDTTVGEAKRNLVRWFADQRIVDDRGGEAQPLSLYRLAGATVRELKDVPPTTPRALIRSALLGSPLPTGLLYQAVRRNRAEQQVTRPRAALIKLVLLSQHRDTQEQMMVELDLNYTDPAYQCGRLLAVLAEIQRNAIGKAALVDRFYGTASSAPAAVFGRLLRGAQPHLSKLERDRPTVARALQRRLEEITAHLRQFPRTLSLEQQGLFALGFYHQRAHDRAQMLAAVEQKKAQTAAGAATDTTTTQE